MFDRFTNRAKTVIGLARNEAERFNHDYIGTEHLLLGLIGEENGIATTVLETLDVDLERTRAEVSKLIKHGPEVAPVGPLPFSPRAKKVLEYAMEEARAMGHSYVGTEHLLLGLIREGHGVAHQVLFSFGVTPGAVRDEVLRLLGREKKKDTAYRIEFYLDPSRPTSELIAELLSTINDIYVSCGGPELKFEMKGVSDGTTKFVATPQEVQP